jgi:Archaeal fructose-1,6-bisphosphatase and related enzymes of inositol monophosphatase family
MQSLSDDLKAAVEARLDSITGILPELGQMLIELQSEDLEIDSKTNEVDLVTKADFASEQRMLAYLREQFPEDGIVTEEGSSSDAEAARSEGFRWILDPIDGTVNYANRMPGWVISIGLLYEGQRVGAIVEAPCLRERFRAVLGEGATLNGARIFVNNKTRLNQGIVGTGFPYDRAKRAEPISRALANMLRESGGVRRLGAAALDMCYVAAGRFVGYYEMSLKPWDCAAGSLIIEEAGGQISDLAGGPHDIFLSKGMAASNGLVHSDLVDAIVPMLEAIALEV